MSYRECLEYVDPRGGRVFTDWLDSSGFSEDDKADVLETIRTLELTKILNRNQWEKLKGPWDGLYEIRLKIAGEAWRPICFKGPGSAQFTIVLIAKMQNSELKPTNGHKAARNIQTLVESDPRRAREFG